MKLWILILAMVAGGMSAAAQVPVVNTLSNLLVRPVSRVQPVVDVLGYDEPGFSMRWRWDSTNALPTNGLRLATLSTTNNATGRWVHDWEGDPRAFGVRIDDATADAANAAAFAAATAYAAANRKPLILPPGDYYTTAPIDALGAVNRIEGGGILGNGATTIFVTTQNTSAITNVGSGAVVRNLQLRPLYYSWGKTATHGAGIHGVAGAAQVLENLYIHGFFYGVDIRSFDSKLTDIDVIAKRPFRVTGSGTQNTFVRCSGRGNMPLTPTEDNASITVASYTAGSTTFTVSDASNIAIGDYIRPRTSTEFANTISYRLFSRKVTNVSGTTVTINYPWPLSFSNALWETLVGKGGSAFEVTTENVLVGCNAEWGTWDHIFTPNSGPTASSTIAGLHVEGWCMDPGSSGYSYVLNGVNTSINATHIDMANCVVFEADGVAVWEPGTRGFLSGLHLRDFDMYHAVPYYYVVRTLTQSYSQRVVTEEVYNAGVNLLYRTVDGNQFRNTVVDLKNGEGGEYVRVDGVGQGLATFYGEGSTPLVGNFLAGDMIRTPTEVIRTLTTGSFRTAAGSNKVRIGSSVLIPNQDARAVLGRRTPVTIGSSQVVVKEQLRNAPDVTTLAANAATGDRMLQLTDASGIQTGDPAVVNFSGTFDDVIVARVQGNYVWLAAPLTNSHTAGATFETGVSLFDVSTVDQATMVPLAFTAPTFSTERNAAGMATAGNPLATTGLTIQGGASGLPGLVTERAGSGTNEWLWSGAQLRVRNKADSKYLFSFLQSGSSLFWTVGDGSQASPQSAVIQGESASGADVAAGTTTIRTGQSTGAGTTPTLALQSTIKGASGSAAQTHVTGWKLKFPMTPDATISNSPLYSIRWDGAAWVEMMAVWTNISGVGWQQVWR